MRRIIREKMRWPGQKLAENDPATTKTRHQPADAPVVALPGHRRGHASSGERVEGAALPQPP
ncbi:MAG: hypothetical protein B7Z73_19825 [Planctomycetia bacterium 21-64-5]|nr:MAG: hypothetical protein B7Z73_19825 [Planctomycetia bacterium 21-64-5]